MVYTNKHPGGQFRGYGAPQATFAIESQMDELADALGVDPIDLRIRNANRPGDVTHTGWKLESARLVECLDAARDAIGWDEKRPWKGSGRGVGVAAAIHVSGAYIYDAANKGSAAIDVHEDGRLVVRHGGSDAGTWQKTVLAQFAAEELGTDVGRFSVVMMDTNQTPVDLGAWSSRGTYVGGHAVVAAGRKMRELLREVAAATLGEHVDAITIGDGVATGATDSITFADLAARHGRDGVLSVTEEVTLDVEPLDRATGVSNISGAYSFAVQAVEVDVDADTGRVRIVDAVSVHDSGVPINPIGLESQIVGGMAMGLGAALGEGLVYEGGRLVNGAYLHYPLPRAADLPPIRPIVLDSYDRNGPHGAKGIGEIVLVPTAAAVANAVAHATGLRIRELPITPDRILAAKASRSPRRRRSYHLWRRPDRWWIAAMRTLYPRGLHTVLHKHGTRFAKSQPPRPIGEIVRPTTVDEAVERLAAGGKAIGGGTDHLPARQQGLAHAGTVVDVALLPELGHLSHDQRGWRIGGAIRLHRLEQGDGTPVQRLVAETVRTIASPQIRAMATVAGNLCQEKRCWFYRNDFACFKRGGWTCPCYAVNGDHRYHHAVAGAHRCQAVTPSDLATTLVALDAEAIVHGRQGRRERADGRLLHRARRDDAGRRRTPRGDRRRRSTGVDACRVREAQAVGGRLRHRQCRRRPATRRRRRASRRGVCRRDRPDTPAAGPAGGRPRGSTGEPRRDTTSPRRDVVEHRPSSRQQRMEARRGDGRGDDGDRPRPRCRERVLGRRTTSPLERIVTIIDTHAHLFPTAWQSLGRMPPDMFDVERQLERMESGGVETCVISDPHIWYGDLDLGDIAQARVYNDFVANLARDHRGTFLGLATVDPVAWRRAPRRGPPCRRGGRAGRVRRGHQRPGSLPRRRPDRVLGAGQRPRCAGLRAPRRRHRRRPPVHVLPPR